MPYGSNFQAVGGFVVFGGNDFGVSGKPKYFVIFSAVMQYKGNWLAVSVFSFFDGDVNVNSELGGNYGSYMHTSYIFGARTGGEPLFDDHP